MIERLDIALVQRGFLKEIKVARGLIMAGKVLVDDQPISKIGFKVSSTSIIRLRGVRRWVSRSAEKLFYFCNSFNLRFDNKVVIDVGASTGGFSQVVLELGGKRVLAIDVGYGQMDQKIATDNRVLVIDRTSICSLKNLPEIAEFFVMDVSFVSSVKALNCVSKLLPQKHSGVLLLKPQFEASYHHIKNGIIRPEFRSQVINNTLLAYNELGYKVIYKADSILSGTHGNLEYLVFLKKV